MKARVRAKTRAKKALRTQTSESQRNLSAHAAPNQTAREIYAVVRAIPRGKIATYGQIGELIGIPAGHRVVARAMRTCPDGLPWQRVVGKKDARRAQVAVQDPEHAALQRRLLTREGVQFDANGYIALKDSGWLPS